VLSGVREKVAEFDFVLGEGRGSLIYHCWDAKHQIPLEVTSKAEKRNQTHG
jgi:hypothetical protein